MRQPDSFESLARELVVDDLPSRGKNEISERIGRPPRQKDTLFCVSGLPALFPLCPLTVKTRVRIPNSSSMYTFHFLKLSKSENFYQFFWIFASSFTIFPLDNVSGYGSCPLRRATAVLLPLARAIGRLRVLCSRGYLLLLPSVMRRCLVSLSITMLFERRSNNSFDFPSLKLKEFPQTERTIVN